MCVKDEHIIRQRNHSVDTPHLSPSYIAQILEISRSLFFGRNNVIFNFTFNICVQVQESENGWILAFMTLGTFCKIVESKNMS